MGIEKCLHKNKSWAKSLLAFGILVNLGALVYYKYSGFILTNLFACLTGIGKQLEMPALANLSSPALAIILPLGISFFVFEFIHYLVDVYRGSKSVRSWLDFSVFSAFFPSQIAGPIKRFQDFQANLKNPLPWSNELFLEGMTLILQGLFKKIAIADPIGWVIAPSYAAVQPISAVDAWIAFIGFSVQIFCDFSGYTDMGRGSALLLGIRLPENFQLPYLAEDIASFWRRWHISLSSWIRDYVYIPLGGSRCSHLRSAGNLFLTMSLCGLWHGAAWQFVAWGAVHGIGLILNREWKRWLDKTSFAPALASFLPARALNLLLTFGFVAACFVMFRAPSFEGSMNIFRSLSNWQMESNTLVMLMQTGVLVFMSVYLFFWLACDTIKLKAGLKLPCQLIFPLPMRLASWTCLLLFLFAAKPTQVTPFIYFQF